MKFYEEIITPKGVICLYCDDRNFNGGNVRFRTKNVTEGISLTGYEADFEIEHGELFKNNVRAKRFDSVNSLSITIAEGNEGYAIFDLYDCNISKSQYEIDFEKEKRKKEKYAKIKANRLNKSNTAKQTYLSEINFTPKRFYVYEHAIKNSDTVFYVGKGTKDRYKQIERNRACNRVWKYNDCIVRIIKDNLTEQEAFALESSRIKELSKKGYILTNILD